MNLVVFLLCFILLGMSFACFDYLLKFQFTNHKNLWIEDGKPTFIWGRPSKTFDISLSSQIAGHAHSLTLVFSNPDWVKENIKLRRIALAYRTGIILFWVIFLIQITRIFNV